MGETRRLAAILAADMVGYSRLMAVDEADTLVRLRRLRAEMIEPAIAAHHGRLVKTTGDGFLVEFASAVDAVVCAVDWQRAMAAHNGEPTDRRIAFRIGINVGDIVAEADDILGDGVNIASRLEGLADPGGIVISRGARDAIRDKLRHPLDDLGEVEVKNIPRPVRAFRVRIDGMATIPASARKVGWRLPAVAAGLAGVAIIGVLALWQPWARPALVFIAEKPLPTVLSDRPTVAVLPFANLSGDPQQEYFSDGISEDLLAALTRFSRLRVIGRNSSFQYKGRNVDLRQIGAELGARYVLEGSVRRDGDRVRITVQLADAASATQVWADKYDSSFNEAFAFGDEVVRRVTSAMSVQILASETALAQRKAPRSMDAYDLTLKARSLVTRGDRASVLESRRVIEQALALDSNYALAHATLQLTLLNTFQNRWNDEYASPRTQELMLAAGSRAFELDPGDPFVLARYASALSFAGRHAEAMAMAERAIAASPNDPNILLFAQTPIYRGGNPARSIEIQLAAMKLDPNFAPFWENSLSGAYFYNGQYGEALAAARRCVASIPNNTLCNIHLVAALSAAGSLDEARLAGVTLLKLNPGFTISEDYLRYSTNADRAAVTRFRDALRRAGLPE
ncbi:MAG: adenylate/guanylate cyclase domain-containing protein [Alphaproteobacteria bacterium]